MVNNRCKKLNHILIIWMFSVIVNTYHVIEILSCKRSYPSKCSHPFWVCLNVCKWVCFYICNTLKSLIFITQGVLLTISTSESHIVSVSLIWGEFVRSESYKRYCAGSGFSTSESSNYLEKNNLSCQILLAGKKFCGTE